MTEIVLTALSASILAAAVFEHRRLLRVIRRGPRPPALDHYPSITVIRPIRGLDCEARQNIEAAFDTGYPGGVDLVFVFDDESEPALPIVEKVMHERAMEGCRDRARIVLCGQPPAHRTGKLHAMLAGMEVSDTELIAFADSDIRADMDVLRTMVETLRSKPDIGSVFPTAVVASEPKTAGDVGAAAMLNSLYIPMASILYKQRGENLPFILGQYMVFERSTLDEVIGLEQMRGQLTDDLYMGSLVNAGGLRNVIAPCKIDIIQHGLGPREAFDQYSRWLFYSRSGMPEWSYKIPTIVRAVLYIAGLALGAGALLQGWWLAAALALGASLMVNHTMVAIHDRVGGARIARRHWLVPGLFFLLVPALFLRIYTQKHVSWRGRTYALNSSATLDEAGGATVDEAAARPGRHDGAPA